jgi:hypothetical protein
MANVIIAEVAAQLRKELLTESTRNGIVQKKGSVRD